MTSNGSVISFDTNGVWQADARRINRSLCQADTSGELPDLEAKTLDDVKLQLAAAFGAGSDVVIQLDRKENVWR